jgi:hypothetical protein
MDNQQKDMMYRANFLKASQLAPEHPWNHTKPDLLGPCIIDMVRSEEPYFRRWAENWYMTMQYVFGQHNFKWSNRHGFAVDYDKFITRKKTKSNFINAYTNISRIAVESLASGLYANAPDWDVDSKVDSKTEGRKQKRIIKSLAESMYEYLQCDKDVAAAAFAFAMFGQFAYESSWDPMLGRMISSYQYKEGQSSPLTSMMAKNGMIPNGLIQIPTPVLGVDGNPAMQNSFTVQRGPNGEMIQNKFMSGGNRMDVLTPFEYRRSIGSIGMHKTRSVRIFRLMDYDKFLDRYGQLPGKTQFFSDIQPVFASESVYDLAFKFYMRMMYVTPPSGMDIGDRFGMTMSGDFRHKVFVIEHYDEPHPLKWPEGRRVIVANGQCTHILKPDYNTGKLDGWHPLSEAQWINAFPSSVTSGPMQDIVKKNQDLDTMDSFIMTSAKRNLAGHTLVAIGSGIEPERMTGEPGVIHEVIDPFGVRILHDDMAIPPVVAEIRNMKKEDAYAESGSLESQRGVVDEGKSGYQTRLFENREEKRLAPSRKQFRNALASACEKNIYCLHKNAAHIDDRLMSYIMASAAGSFTESDVISFLKNPIAIGTKIKIVESSMNFKSSDSIKADLVQVVQNPAVMMRLQNNPKVLDQYLKIFGAEAYRDKSHTHWDKVERENERFHDLAKLGLNSQIVKPVVIWEDDDVIHEEDHSDFIVENWELLQDKPDVLFEIYLHLEQHRIQKEIKLGRLLPGTSLRVPQMMAMSGGQQPPQPQEIMLDSMMKQQMIQAGNQQQQQQQGQAGPERKPESPAKQNPGFQGEGNDGQK